MSDRKQFLKEWAASQAADGWKVSPKVAAEAIPEQIDSWEKYEAWLQEESPEYQALP